MKRLRLLIVLLLLVPAVLLSWLTMTQSGLNWVYQQVEFYLPAELNFSQLQGKLIGPVTIKDVEYQQDGALIQAEQIIIDWLPASLLAANINIKQLHIQSLNIVLPEREDTKTDQQSATKQAIILPEINLPWRLLLKDAEIDGINIRQGEHSYKLKKFKLNASTLFSQIDIKELDLNADTFKLNIRGDLQPTGNYQHDLKIKWQAVLPSTKVLQGSGRLLGNMKSSSIKQTVSGPLQLTLDAKLNDPLKQLNWLAKIEATQFDAEKLDASWPALSGTLKLDAKGDLSTATLSGALQGKYPEMGKLDANFNLQRLANNHIQIDQLNLHAPETDTHLEASGLWAPGNNVGENGGDLKLALHWQNLRWPMQDTPWFDSTSGSGSIEGNIDHYQIVLDTDSPWPQAAPSTWHASATGNLDGMKIQTLRIKALNGEANVGGQLNWSPQLNWQAEGSINNIDPATMWPQWPGRLEGNLTSSGRLNNDQLVIEADISQLKGKLRGHPVSLRSRLAWRENHLDISQLNFISGKSQVQLNGQLGNTLKLNWRVDSNDLAELYPQTKGQLQAHGKLDGPRDTPMAEATFNGKALSYLNNEIGNIEGAIAVDLFHWQKTDIKLAAQAIKINDYKLLSLDIDANNQRIKAQTESDQATAQIELTGEAHATGWRGRIEKADIQSKQFDNWALETPVKLSLDDNNLLLDSLCWHSSQQASFCASVKQEKTTWLSSINISNFPLRLLEQWLPSDLKFESVANGNAEIEFQSPEKLLAQIDIELPAGTINYPMLNGENDQRQYSGGKIQMILNAQGLDASSEITMANGDHISAQLVLPGVKPLAAEHPDQSLQASAQLNARDLGLIETFIPEIYKLQGELNLKLSASGTLDQPIVSGSANFINGALQIPGLGLNIDQVTLKSQSDSSKNFNFHLDARSGDGQLAIAGFTKLDRAAGWPTEISIKGDQFEVSRIPEARLLASPDLQIKLKNRAIDIKGNVHIPYAKLQPKDITQAASVSKDAVIVGGEQPAEEKWLINTAVRLTLGDRVHFYGFGFEGRLGGNLLLQDEPGQLTKATGEITIPEGTYRAYGQRLDVEKGRILYTGGPLTNPGLDLRAVRKVDDVIAGIYVKGSLSQPQLEIFSTPAMAQTDALAYIMLGGPIENASSEDGAVMAKAALALGLSGGDSIARSLGDRFGLDDFRVESSDKGDQAALVVGRYLSPRLYASYGVGLLESVNTLTLRYKISKKWQIKAESGEAQGADILYTFER